MFNNTGHSSEERRKVDEAPEPVLESALERKSWFQAALPAFACGAGLFSDGYVNNVSN